MTIFVKETRWLALMLGLLAASLPSARAGAPLPQRNLLVEWRVNGAGQADEQALGVQGGRVVHRRSSTVSTVVFGAGGVQTETQGSTVQQVLVLNGGQARLFLGQSQPQTVWQWGMSVQPMANTATSAASASSASSASQSGAQVWAQTVMVDLGQGMLVKPRWPGGHAPVRVDLEARSRVGGGVGPGRYGSIESDGPVRQSELTTTVLVPMGQWTVLARSGEREQQSQSGTLSTRSLDAQRSEQVEIRISVP
jgi:hypothetical protein